MDRKSHWLNMNWRSTDHQSFSPVAVMGTGHFQSLQMIIIKFLWLLTLPFNVLLQSCPTPTKLHLHGSQVLGEQIEQANSEVKRPDDCGAQGFGAVGRTQATGWENLTLPHTSTLLHIKSLHIWHKLDAQQTT